MSERVWIATFIVAYEGTDIVGVFKDVETAKTRCMQHNLDLRFPAKSLEWHQTAEGEWQSTREPMATWYEVSEYPVV